MHFIDTVSDRHGGTVQFDQYVYGTEHDLTCIAADRAEHALENYKNSKTDVKTLQKLPLSLLQKFTDGIGASSDSKYDVGGGAFSNSMVFTDYLSLSTVKKRFASYLGGNTENADKMLQNMGVVDGLNGIKIKSGKISGNDVVIEISYKVRLIFYIEMFHFGEFESTQKVCCRLWK